MTKNLIDAVKKGCLWVFVIASVGANVLNYFFVDDRELQWMIAMIAYALCLFLGALFMWFDSQLRKKSLTIVITGWVALFLLFDLVGVIKGYNLHTRGFVALMIVTMLAGTGHISIRLWQKYF